VDLMECDRRPLRVLYSPDPGSIGNGAFMDPRLRGDDELTDAFRLRWVSTEDQRE